VANPQQHLTRTKQAIYLYKLALIQPENPSYSKSFSHSRLVGLRKPCHLRRQMLRRDHPRGLTICESYPGETVQTT
jgi:hypothetical protein